MNKLKIMDEKNGALSFDLIDILIPMEKFCKSYEWAILDIYLTSKYGSQLNVLELEDKVNNNDILFVLSFEELKHLAAKFNQLLDGKILGSKIKFPRKDYSKKYLELNADIIIEAVDSSYWTVYSKNKELITILENIFKNTELI
jgi:hypothetical protein